MWILGAQVGSPAILFSSVTCNYFSRTYLEEELNKAKIKPCLRKVSLWLRCVWLMRRSVVLLFPAIVHVTAEQSNVFSFIAGSLTFMSVFLQVSTV